MLFSVYLKGVFDFDRKTWTMWTNAPSVKSPILQLPLTFTDLITPSDENEIDID